MKRLMELRESRGISKHALAKQLGISDVAVLRLEQGRSNPSVDLLKRIADYFEVTTDYLLERDSTMIDAADRELLNRFKGLTTVQKNAILKIIETFEKKNRK